MSDLYSQGEGHPHAKHFSDLMVWRESRALAQEVFEATKAFPSEEFFATEPLTDHGSLFTDHGLPTTDHRK